MYYSSSSGSGDEHGGSKSSRSHSSSNRSRRIIQRPRSGSGDDDNDDRSEPSRRLQEQVRKLYAVASGEYDNDYISSSHEDGEDEIDAFSYDTDELLRRSKLQIYGHQQKIQKIQQQKQKQTPAPLFLSPITPISSDLTEGLSQGTASQRTASERTAATVYLGEVEDVTAQQDESNKRKDNDNADGETIISTLKLEEKIVALMNRIWILETENDVLRSEEWRSTMATINSAATSTTTSISTKTDGGQGTKGTIEDLYQNPYQSHLNGGNSSKTNGDFNSDVNTSADTDVINNTTTPPMTVTTVMDPSPAILWKTLHEQLSLRQAAAVVATQKKDYHENLSRVLKKELALSETVRERMRIAMVSLEKRDKLQSELVKELTTELEQAREEVSNRGNNSSNDDTREDSDPGTYLPQHLQQHLQPQQQQSLDPSSSDQAAQMISDLSSELRMTLERESDLSEALAEARRDLAAERQRHRDHESRSAEAAREATSDMETLSGQLHALRRQRQIQMDKHEALAMHTADLESRNKMLVDKFGTLEARFLDFVERNAAHQQRQHHRQQQQHSRRHIHPDDQQYVSSLESKNRKHKKEIAILNNRLLRSETALTEFLARFSNPSPMGQQLLHARSPPNTTKALKQRRSSYNSYSDYDNSDSYSHSQTTLDSLWNDLGSDKQRGVVFEEPLSASTTPEDSEDNSDDDDDIDAEQREDDNSDVEDFMFPDRVEI